MNTALLPRLVEHVAPVLLAVDSFLSSAGVAQPPRREPGTAEALSASAACRLLAVKVDEVAAALADLGQRTAAAAGGEWADSAELHRRASALALAAQALGAYWGQLKRVAARDSAFRHAGRLAAVARDNLVVLAQVLSEVISQASGLAARWEQSGGAGGSVQIDASFDYPADERELEQCTPRSLAYSRSAVTRALVDAMPGESPLRALEAALPMAPAPAAASGAVVRVVHISAPEPLPAPLAPPAPPVQR